MNIMHFGIKWKGLASPPADAGDYCIFLDPVMGIRAGAMDLLNDWLKDGKRTVEALIEEYAPRHHRTESMPKGNDTRAYIVKVSAALDVRADDEIDLNDYGQLSTMVKAIIRHENGSQPFPESTIRAALAMAGVVPTDEPTLIAAAPPKPLEQTRTAQGGAISAFTGLGGVIAILTQMRDVFAGNEAAWSVVQWGFVIALVCLVLSASGGVLAIVGRRLLRKRHGV